MRNFLLLVLILFSTSLSYGQNITDAVAMPCPHDSSSTIYLPEGWQMYETVNDEWDGPIDTTKCLSFIEGSNQLDLSTIDSTAVVFLRYVYDDDSKVSIQSNYCYSVYYDLVKSNSLMIDQNCVEAPDHCSQVILGIEAPNETGDSTNMFYYNYPTSELEDFNDRCLNTHYLPNQYWKETVVQIAFNDMNMEGDQIIHSSPYIDNSYDVTLIDEDVILNGDPDQLSYNISCYDLAGEGDFYDFFLVVHDQTIYPTDNYISYIDIYPPDTTTTTTMKEINLNGYGTESLQYAPGAALRGGLIAGSDTLRHQLNIALGDFAICMPLLEVTIAERVSLIMGSGSVYLGGVNSCLSVRDGGRFVVTEGAEVVYGQEGIGMLAFQSGSNLVLEPNSTMIMNSQLVLVDNYLTEEKQMYVDLQPGSKFIFSETAGLMQKKFANGYLMLNVYMNGGEIDESHLSAEERLLINKIYPEVSPYLAENIRIVDNPIMDKLTFELVVDDEQSIDWQIIGIDGKLYKQASSIMTKGRNNKEINVADLNNGVYILTVQTPKGNTAVKWIKAE